MLGLRRFALADRQRRRRHLRPRPLRLGSARGSSSASAPARCGATLDGVELTTDDGERRRFDKVVVATHADQALALLEDPSDDERRVLGAFGYTRNDAVLHTDERLLPRAAPRAPRGTTGSATTAARR